MSTIVLRLDGYLAAGSGARKHLIKSNLAVEVANEADCKTLTIAKDNGEYLLDPTVPNNKVMAIVASAPLEIEITREDTQSFSFTLVGFFVFPDSLQTVRLVNTDIENAVEVELIHGKT